MIIKNNKKGNVTVWITVITIALVVVGLLALPRLAKNNIATGVPCLVPSLPLVVHIHSELTIEVDGKNETVPTDIGLGGACEHAVHTHDDTGTIHVEAQAARDYNLKDFFDVWGKTIAREGYDLVMRVDGATSSEYGALILKDGQKIVLKYNKK